MFLTQIFPRAMRISSDVITRCVSRVTGGVTDITIAPTVRTKAGEYLLNLSVRFTQISISVKKYYKLIFYIDGITQIKLFSHGTNEFVRLKLIFFLCRCKTIMCPDSKFLCEKDHMCIDKEKLCDNKADCEDGSDERKACCK